MTDRTDDTGDEAQESKPFRDADETPPGSVDDASATTDAAARSNYALHGALGGAQTGMTGYATGAITAAGDEGDAGMSHAEATGEDPGGTGAEGSSTQAPDTRGIDEPVGPSEVAGPDDPDA